MNQSPQSIQSAEHLDPNHLGPDTLSAFIDGELSPVEQQGIEQHLATCHACTLRVLSATKLKAAPPALANASPHHPKPWPA